MAGRLAHAGVVRAVRATTAILAGGLLALAWPVPADAAPLSALDELPGAAAPAGASVLDKALTGALAGGNTNLDLLLAMQRDDAAEARRPTQPRPDAGTSAGAVGPPGGPAVNASVQAAGKPVPDPFQSQTVAVAPPTATPRAPAVPPSLLVATGSGLGGSSRAVPVQAKPDWIGAPAVPMGMTSAGPEAGRGGRGFAPLGYGLRNEADDSAVRSWIGRTREFLQDYREWLLVGGALLLLLGGLAKAYARRV